MHGAHCKAGAYQGMIGTVCARAHGGAHRGGGGLYPFRHIPRPEPTSSVRYLSISTLSLSWSSSICGKGFERKTDTCG